MTHKLLTQLLRIRGRRCLLRLELQRWRSSTHLSFHARYFLLVHGEVLLGEVLDARFVVIRFDHLLNTARKRALRRPLRFRLDQLLRGGYLLELARSAARRLMVPLVHLSARRAGLGRRLRRRVHIRSRMNAHVLITGAGLCLVAALARVPLLIYLRLGSLVERAARRLSVRKLRRGCGNLVVARGIVAGRASHELVARRRRCCL